MSDHQPITKEQILRTAMRLADEGGLDAVSMRRIGKQLGVEGMALYNHIENKDAILDGIMELVLSEIVVPSPGTDWKEAMRRRAHSARTVFARHPWAIGILEARSEDSSPRRLDYYDSILGSLRDAGFDNQMAMRGFSILDAYIYGFILQEASLPFDDPAGLQEVGTDLLRQMADAYPHLAAVTEQVLSAGYDFEEEFSFGLDLVIEALEGVRDRLQTR